MEWLRNEVKTQIAILRDLWDNKRQFAFQILNLAMIVFSALMLWKGLMVVTASESPIVVVLSGSMEPAFQRGDILFLSNLQPRVEVGDIVVYSIKGRDVPIVHRVLRVHEAAAVPTKAGAVSSSSSFSITGLTSMLGFGSGDNNSSAVGHLDMLTKGDNNAVDDRNLYIPPSMDFSRRQPLPLWLTRDSVLGTARASLPYLGMATVLLNDYPLLKYVLVGLMGLYVLTTKEKL